MGTVEIGLPDVTELIADVAQTLTNCGFLPAEKDQHGKVTRNGFLVEESNREDAVRVEYVIADDSMVPPVLREPSEEKQRQRLEFSSNYDMAALRPSGRFNVVPCMSGVTNRAYLLVSLRDDT